MGQGACGDHKAERSHVAMGRSERSERTPSGQDEVLESARNEREAAEPPRLPTPLCQPVGFGDLFDVDADHGFTESA